MSRTIGKTLFFMMSYFFAITSGFGDNLDCSSFLKVLDDFSGAEAIIRRSNFFSTFDIANFRAAFPKAPKADQTPELLLLPISHILTNETQKNIFVSLTQYEPRGVLDFTCLKDAKKIVEVIGLQYFQLLVKYLKNLEALTILGAPDSIHASKTFKILYADIRWTDGKNSIPIGSIKNYHFDLGFRNITNLWGSGTVWDYSKKLTQWDSPKPSGELGQGQSIFFNGHDRSDYINRLFGGLSKPLWHAGSMTGPRLMINVHFAHDHDRTKKVGDADWFPEYKITDLDSILDFLLHNPS